MNPNCRVDGCSNSGEHSFAIAISRNDVQDTPSSADGNICSEHANGLWSLLGAPPKRATQIMAEEFCKELNDGADEVVIRMDKRLAGL